MIDNNKNMDFFSLLFNGINIDSPLFPTERFLAETNNLNRSQVSNYLNALRTVGIVSSKQGSGNRLITDEPDKIASGALKSTIYPLIHFGYFSSEMVNEAREKIELLTFDDWLTHNSKTKRFILMNLEYTVYNMKELLEETNITQNDDINMVVKYDVEFHELLGKILKNTFFKALSEAMAQLRTQKIENFWLNANNIEKAALIDVHFSIYNALKSEDKNSYIKAIESHYLLI